MTDATLRLLQRRAADDPGAAPALLAATLRAGLEPSLDLLARAADAAGRPRPVLWLCMRTAKAHRLHERATARGLPVADGPAWHRVSVDLGLVAQAGRVLEATTRVGEHGVLVREAQAAPDGHLYVARGLPLRSPCGALGADVSEVRLAWRPGPADGAQGWCARCGPNGHWPARGVVRGLHGDAGRPERALGLACAVVHPWDRRGVADRGAGSGLCDVDGLPRWVSDVGLALAQIGHPGAWLYRLAVARIPLEGA